MLANEIRRAFLDFFVKREHHEVHSGPLVPPNDPSLMFANAGMVQFKDAFTGREDRGYVRATSSQKCIRISGKHNDFEAVGPSPRHHTFFEMLGNFSFGDYFKEEAIVFAWEFLREIGVPQDKLVFTYFGGEGDLPADNEARDLWKKVTGYGDERIIACGKDENFWQMGETGPCGPSSEIHIFNGDQPDFTTFGAEQTSDGQGWMEIWNLVFMQFERSRAGDEFRLDPLPKPSIDTGAGLERLACVLQGKYSNYESDLLRALVDEAASISAKSYGGTMEPDDVSMRVIADHARTTAFLIAEGILPDRAARPYVLRRVMRRAIRHGHRLGIAEPFLDRVALRVVELMGDQYPELVERRELIESVARQEEVRFRQTIERGLALLDDRFEELGASGSRTLPGDDVFKLYDTYGFPDDLTRIICEERDWTVDVEGFEAAREKAREQSQFASKDQAVESVYRDVLASLPDTGVQFVGYDKNQAKSEVVAIVSDGQLVDRVEASESEVEVIVAKTPFYAESGGQVGDAGEITGPGGSLTVVDTKKPVDSVVVHRGTVTGALAVGDAVELLIDVERRDAIRRNHSATHLLHWALREVVGKHAQQKGSQVGPDRLRFDFTHGQALTAVELAEIERLVNARVVRNAPVTTEIMTMDQARERGAMMIFEEKYGDTVRMLTMAESTELCGGTHARATGDLGFFKIISEEGVAAGVRRMVAVTGDAALEYVQQLEERMQLAARVAKAQGGDLVAKIEKIIASERAAQKQIAELQRQLIDGGGGGGLEALLKDSQDVDGIPVLGVASELADRAALRELAEKLRDKLGESVVLVGSVNDGKVQLVLTVAKSLTSRLKAGDLIKQAAQHVDGSGGGRPDMAQAGGTKVDALPQAVTSVYDAVRARL